MCAFRRRESSFEGLAACSEPAVALQEIIHMKGTHSPPSVHCPGIKVTTGIVADKTNIDYTTTQDRGFGQV